ncbi:MAG: phosphoadenylyl-sulfate reductase [Myxococcales bacterium]|jgi:phosphoadenosine phosphosulfate reductase|nr:MAG: phosphoadenylyl-sulfate reductase [Myxococcales bacterium]
MDESRWKSTEPAGWAEGVARRDATGVLEWASERFGDGLAVSTSFGIHSAAILHLVTAVRADTKVIWVDTGYLPTETYRYADELTQQLGLDLHVAQSPLSPARMEASYGKLWEKGDVASLDLYDRIRKVEPMKNALAELDVRAWIAGLRAEQTDHRRSLPAVGTQWGRTKILPILGWSSEQVHDYLRHNNLPFHPLHEQGYTTVGDWHSSRPANATDGHERETRFGGLKQECGLHLP